MTLTFVAMFIILWVTQMGLTYWQAQKFMRSVAQLRALGDTFIGRYRKRGLRTYVTLAIRDDRVVDSRVLAGFTVFAKPAAEPLLVNARVEDVLDEAVPGLTLRTAKAAAEAAGFYRQQQQRAVSAPSLTP